MTIRLDREELAQTIDRAYLLATSDKSLPTLWLLRSEQLADSPSVGFVAAVGAALLAKATNSAVDSFVIQQKEGSAGAYALRSAATALAQKRRAYGYDIGSSSDRDPINHGTLIGSQRWDLALDRILPAHKPFFQVILSWLPDINEMSEMEALDALAAFVRVRREVSPGAAVEQVPETLDQPPELTDLIEVLEGFSSADTERGARGMALVAAAYRAAGYEADVPSRNDPRRIDIPIKIDGSLVIGSEVKQQATHETTADTLARDTLAAGATFALLAVLPPGSLTDFDKLAVIRRVEREHGIVLRVVTTVRELLHEALASGDVPARDFAAVLPRAYAEALRDIRAENTSIDTWAAIAKRWDY